MEISAEEAITFKFLFGISAFLTILSLCALVFAQGLGGTTGTLSGDVTDDLHNPLSAVLVTANAGDGIKTAKSDAEGKYIFPYLTPASYVVRAALTGFSTVEQTDVRIGLGQHIEISFRLKHAVHEIVIVTNESGLPDLTGTDTGANISDQLMQRIPIGRSLADVIYLAPGVSASGLAGANFSISGGSGWDNAYIVDGAVVTNPGFGGMGVVSLNQSRGTINTHDDKSLPVEMIKEVQIITGGFEPEFGEAQGGVINVVTKSGTDHLHGDAFNYTNPKNAGDELSRQDNSLDIGGNIGGSIIKNRLFFFGAYNLTTSKNTLFLRPEWPGYAVLTQVSEKNISHSYSMKITANITRQQMLEVAAFGDPSYRPLSNHDGYQLDSSIHPKMAQSTWHLGTSTQSLRWTGNLRPSMFAEAQFARSQNTYLNTPDPMFKTLPRIVVDETGQDIGGFGGNIDFQGNNLQYRLKFTNVWKNHQFRYGLQFEDISFSENLERTGGPFTLPNGQVATSGYRVDIINGHDVNGEDWGFDRIYAVNALLSPPLLPTKTKYLNWFAQDSWNLTSALNVNLGIRWEQQQIRGTSPDSIRVTLGNNWAPRIGATYDYLNNGKSKLFFHYGRFFERLPNDIATQFTNLIVSNSYFSDSNLTKPVGGIDVNSSFHLFNAGIVEVEGHGKSRSSFRTGAQFSDEWVVGTEREVKSGFSLGGHFIFRKLGRAIENMLVNQDSPCVTLSSGACVYAPTTLEEQINYPVLTGILTNVDGHIPGVPALTRDYKAVELTVEKRLSNRWQLMGSYRYARLIGNYEGGDQNAGSAGDLALSPLTRFVWAKGPLPNDVRNMVKLFGSYQLRNNLNTGVAFYFETGRPITPFAGGDFGDLQIASRGALGRTDSITSVDIHADYGISFLRSQQITVGLDIFNCFNWHAVTAIDQYAENYFVDNLSQPEPNPNFLNPIEYQPPRTFRFLLRYSF